MSLICPLLVPSPVRLCRKTNSRASLTDLGWHTGGGGQQAPSRPAAKTVGSSAICSAPLRSDMVVYEPLMERKLHSEPISDILVTDTVLYTADRTGVLRAWQRPAGGGCCPAAKC